MRNQITPRQRQLDLKRQARKKASGAGMPAKPEGPGAVLDIITSKAHKVLLTDTVSTINGQPVLKHRREWLPSGRIDLFITADREYRFAGGRFDSWKAI